MFIEHKKSFSFSLSPALRKSERQKFFLIKTGSKKFHNGKQVQQQQHNKDITAPPQTFFIMDLNPGNQIQWESRKIQPLIKRLFLSKNISNVPLAGRLKDFVGAWMSIAEDSKLLDTVKAWKIQFHSKPFQSEIPQPIVGRKGEDLVNLEVKEVLKKWSIKKIQPSKGEFVSNLFLLTKKHGGAKTSDKLESTECRYSILPL